MHFHCSNCYQRLAIEDDRAGESFSCPACAGLICVPQAPSAIYKGRRRNKGGIRLVPVAAADRILRRGSLATRVAALRAVPSARESVLL